ncbi:MAG TPA: methylmalonyl-CoA mutase family protein [Bacteroidales bacterium]|nr:methylmalonyl-CoA mutase family protein [Bacteroidales bacterium]
MAKKKNLFDQFPPVTTEEWKGKILSDLKGADFKKLVWKTGHGIEVMPFYREEDLGSLIAGDTLPGEFPYRRGTKTNNNNWLIRQDIKVKDYCEANSKALDMLMKGVDSLGFIIGDPSGINRENFDLLLKDILIDAVELNFRSEGKAKEVLGIVAAICSERSIGSGDLKGAIEADPLGRLMKNGTLCIPPKEGFDYLADLTKRSLGFPLFKTIDIKASDIDNAGGDMVQELAFALSMGCEYMVQMTERGIGSEEAASKIRFTFGIGSNYFPEIAKLRAARILWSAVLKGFCKENCPPMEIHCVTTRWNKTVFDPYVNMLRNQTEAMSAVLGGTNSLTVEPFDAAYREADVFSERISRNQQLILKEEARFDKVSDPSAGSYYIEKLTDLLAEAAWKLYLETEEQGGFLSALQKGFVQKNISESASQKKKDVATRRKILLGTNQYANSREKLPQADSIVKSTKSSAIDVEPIKIFRGAEDYETIRMSVESSGKKPHVFLLPLGNPLMRKARAQFSSVFFACGGYRVTDNHGFESVESGVSAAIDAKPDIVVICSSDEEYATAAPEIYNNLKDKCIVVVAGNPACAEELRSAGIVNFIHVKSDVPETLRQFNLKFGINTMQ